MKAILEFDLDQLDQRMEHLRCVKSLELAVAVQELSDLMSTISLMESEFDKEFTVKELKDYIEVRTKEILEENRITINELVG